MQPATNGGAHAQLFPFEDLFLLQHPTGVHAG